MTDQKVLTIELNLSRLNNKIDFLRVMNERFCLPYYFSFNFESLNECMRDLSWFKENYINAIFSNLSKISNSTLQSNIKDCLELWKEYWDNAESYQEYHDLHPYGKTVVITF